MNVMRAIFLGADNPSEAMPVHLKTMVLAKQKNTSRHAMVFATVP